MAEVVTTAETETSKPKKSRNYKSWLLWLLVIAASVAAGYFWRTYIDRQDQKTQAAHTVLLQNQIDELRKAAAKKPATKAPATTTPAATAKQPSAATIENIKASITSGNTAALEGYMAPSVHVVIAASEGVFDHSPSQVVSDLSYLDNATAPWNFDPSAATLAAWRAGSYGSYFPATVVAGESANHYVIAFNFDSNGKINGVFMSANSDLLNQ